MRFSMQVAMCDIDSGAPAVICRTPQYILSETMETDAISRGGGLLLPLLRRVVVRVLESDYPATTSTTTYDSHAAIYWQFAQATARHAKPTEVKAS